MREIGRGLRSGRIRVQVAETAPEEFAEEIELTRAGIPARKGWAGLPRWVQIVIALASIVPVVVTAIVQIIGALSSLR